MLIEEKSKTCTNCKETLPFSSFHKNRTKSDGRESWCKYCKKEYKYHYRKGVRKRKELKPNEYNIREEVSEVKIYRLDGSYEIVLISTEDIEKVNKYKWYLNNPSGNIFYAYTNDTSNNDKLKIFSMHRLIMDFPENLEVDHIDRDSLNNTRGNLRAVTSYENTMNRRVTSEKVSDVKGVTWDKRSGKWLVTINADGKYMYFGKYTFKDEAVKTRISLEKLIKNK